MILMNGVVLMKQIDIVSMSPGSALYLRQPYRRQGAAHLLIEKGSVALAVELTHGQTLKLAEQLMCLVAPDAEEGEQPQEVLGSELVSRAINIKTELKGLAEAYRVLSPKSMFPEGTKLIEGKIEELQTSLAELENTNYVPQLEKESVNNG